MVSAYQGVVRDGQIQLQGDLQLPEGSEVIVVLVGSAETVPMTAADFAASEVAGLWADRADITDSSAYARQLREMAQKRNGDAAS